MSKAMSVTAWVERCCMHACHSSYVAGYSDWWE